ncbi:hypothetical protein AURDEDRAFT_116298 [Auricularia subglabra TFB-10046 SS5]|nr:hypothetical protein AURDEDRAFT_116298 [Auricularia subglabra TFB-10046 SS5]
MTRTSLPSHLDSSLDKGIPLAMFCLITCTTFALSCGQTAWRRAASDSRRRC